MKPISADSLLRSGEISFEFFRSAGPGGQNVNKVSTGVRLRWDLSASKVIPDGVRSRLSRKAGRRITEGHILTIEARRFRTQEKNRADALRRLDDLIRSAWSEPKPRRRTKPTRASKERRLEEKKRQALLKKRRSSSDETIE